LEYYKQQIPYLDEIIYECNQEIATMKRKRLFISVSFVFLLTLVSVIFYNRVIVSAQKAYPRATPVPEDVGLASIGIRYGEPTSLPLISQTKAIETARFRAGALVEQATEIVANYILFSDDQNYTVDVRSQKQYKFQNVTAWVVTFKGVSFYRNGPGGGPPNTEINVVINAVTGEYMELFSYR
jgi:hypothetical protein